MRHTANARGPGSGTIGRGRSAGLPALRDAHDAPRREARAVPNGGERTASLRLPRGLSVLRAPQGVRRRLDRRAGRGATRHLGRRRERRGGPRSRDGVWRAGRAPSGRLGSALYDVAEEIDPHSLVTEPVEGLVDRGGVTVKLADDPSGVLTDVGSSDVRNDVERLDQSGDDRLPDQFLREGEPYPHTDHGRAPGKPR